MPDRPRQRRRAKTGPINAERARQNGAQGAPIGRKDRPITARRAAGGTAVAPDGECPR